MLKLVFLGSDPIALPLLDWLAGEGSGVARVVAVFTQPDRPVGRGQKITANAIKTWAMTHGLPVFQPDKITSDVRDQLALLQADASLVMAYGHILKQDFIDTPRLGTLNLHASLLPKYRGASPIQTAIANGERETGVSLMKIVRQLDAGPVADIERVPIAQCDTALEIEQKLARACVPLLARTLPLLVSGNLRFTAQNHGEATFCRRLFKDDGRLDFSLPANAIAARINGLFPWPACSVEAAGQPVKIGLADVLCDESASTTTPAPAPGANFPGNNPAGTVLGSDNEGLLVSTGSGVLRCLRLQKPGGKMLPAREFLRGFPILPGTVFSSNQLPALVASTLFPYKKPNQA